MNKLESDGIIILDKRAVRFRKWSGQSVKDDTIQEWAMGGERLKRGICLPLFSTSAKKCTGQFTDIQASRKTDS